MMDKLQAWVRAHLPLHCSCADILQLTSITGDAGFRQYFRVDTSPTLIAVYAPPDKEDIPAFVTKDIALAKAGVAVPAIYAVDYREGFLLQEDLGDQLMLPLLNCRSVDALYGASEVMLRRIQSVSPDRAVFPDYDRTLLLREMGLFPQWFVEELLGVSLSRDDRRIIDSTFERLVDSALEQPQVVVHRDYHSRNLMLQPDGSVGVVDFQDAVIGPFAYDLVSLLKDCYIRWPAVEVRERAHAFLGSFRSEGYISADSGQLLRWFDFMGLQRHIKVLGIFSRLWLRDHKARYLNDLPLVLRYTLEAAGSYPELTEFYNWFLERLLPEMSGQSWYREWSSAGEML